MDDLLRHVRAHVGSLTWTNDSGRPSGRVAIPVCDTCGRLAVARPPGVARQIVAGHVAWTRDHPDLAAAVAAERVAAVDAYEASIRIHSTPGTEGRRSMLFNLPPLYPTT